MQINSSSPMSQFRLSTSFAHTFYEANVLAIAMHRKEKEESHPFVFLSCEPIHNRQSCISLFV